MSMTPVKITLYRGEGVSDEVIVPEYIVDEIYFLLNPEDGEFDIYLEEEFGKFEHWHFTDNDYVQRRIQEYEEDQA